MKLSTYFERPVFGVVAVVGLAIVAPVLLLLLTANCSEQVLVSLSRRLLHQTTDRTGTGVQRVQQREDGQPEEAGDEEVPKADEEFQHCCCRDGGGGGR